MKSQHNSRNWNTSERTVIRPTEEYTKLEIITFIPEFTKMYSKEHQNYTTNNAETYQWLSWTGEASLNKETRFEINCPYNITEKGEYRIDILYANKDDRDMDGFFQIFKNNNKIHDETVIYKGDEEFLKRITIYQNFTETGEITFKHRLPVNSIFLGCIVRKTKYYVGDNIGSIETNIAFTGATVNQSNNLTTDLNATISYDENIVCYDHPSGYDINHRDEINYYVKDHDNKIQRVFGGYVSSILPDNKFTKLTITAKDRLVDGEKRYILEQLVLLGGDKEVTEYFYYNSHDFISYGECLKYLCDNYEVGLNNNVNENFLVGGENYKEGFTATFGSYGTLNTPATTGMQVSEYESYCFFRNNSDNHAEQKAYIWSNDEYNVDPVDITNFPNFYITYGLKDPKQEGNSGVGSGWQYDGKSSDGSQIMAIGKPSAAGEGGYAYNTWWKSVFECKCPFCGSTDLRWAQGWSSSNYGYCPTTGKYEGGSLEGHIFCMGCDADFSCILGADHTSPPRAYLNRISGPEETTEDDLNALKNGSGSSGGGSSEDVSNLLDEIGNEAAGYGYCSGCSTYECMASSGCGECWAMSDFIFKKFSGAGVSCRILEYVATSSNHRSVQYKDANGEWTPFPYRAYGVNTNFNDTDNQWNGRVVAEFDGVNYTGQSGTGTGKTIGYDKDKPFLFTIPIYFKTDYTGYTNREFCIILNFTINGTHQFTFSGLKPVLINNTIRRSSIEVVSRMRSVLEDIIFEETSVRPVIPEATKFFITKIRFVNPNTNNTLYDDEKNDSSCKMDIYGLGFTDGTLINPTDLSSCGKTIKDLLSTIIKTSGYRVKMKYNTHRVDDIIDFSVDNQSEPKITVKEGVDGNILDISSVAFNPITTLFNNSIEVYKYYMDDTNQTKYFSVNSKNSDSVLEYGELSTLETNSDEVHSHEAYYKARHNEKFNPNLEYSYHVTLPFYTDLMIGDLVKIVADDKKINDIQKISSIKITYNPKKVPRIQMEIGLGEQDKKTKLREKMQGLIAETKKEKTLFSRTAELVSDKNIYQWD